MPRELETACTVHIFYTQKLFSVTSALFGLPQGRTYILSLGLPVVWDILMSFSKGLTGTWDSQAKPTRGGFGKGVRAKGFGTLQGRPMAWSEPRNFSGMLDNRCCLPLACGHTDPSRNSVSPAWLL